MVIVHGYPCFHLILKIKWFNEIIQGTKKIEYRDNTDYYRRILNRKIKYIKFQYGYTKSYMIVECTDVILKIMINLSYI